MIFCSCSNATKTTIETYKKIQNRTKIDKDFVVFDSSDKGLNDFLNDFLKRHLRYDDNRIGKLSVGNAVMFDKEWESQSLMWFDTTSKTVPDARLLSYAGNTIIVTLFNVLAIPFAASLCAFGFTKLNFKGKELLFALVLATIMMPAITTQIPLYVMYSKIGWIDSLYPLTIPAIFGGGAMNIFLIRQFMKGLPKELDNAAKIDGANTWKIYWKITLPLCKPILSFVMVSTFLGVWNDFMGPLLYLRTEKNFTLSIGVYMKYLGTLTKLNLPNEQMATGILMLLPPLIIFIIFQKQLINGVVFSGIKG